MQRLASLDNVESDVASNYRSAASRNTLRCDEDSDSDFAEDAVDSSRMGPVINILNDTLVPLE